MINIQCSLCSSHLSTVTKGGAVGSRGLRAMLGQLAGTKLLREVWPFLVIMRLEDLMSGAWCGAAREHYLQQGAGFDAPKYCWAADLARLEVANIVSNIRTFSIFISRTQISTIKELKFNVELLSASSYGCIWLTPVSRAVLLSSVYWANFRN